MPDVVEVKATFKTYQAENYDHKKLGLTDEQLVDMYRNMLLQRRFEERAAQMYGKQKIAGFLHLYIGEEAISTGTAWAMKIGLDSVITGYRDHGIALAMGVSPNAGMAELFGKIDGTSRGKGGSMHFFSAEKRMYGGHGIVGGHIAVGVGLAFAHKYKEDGGVCMTFFGDGAVNQGSFHEAANLASLYELPAILIIENNQYAMGTSVDRAAAEPDLFKQALGYNIPASVVNGMDMLACYAAMKDHIALARDNQPSLIEMRTYRYRGHSMSDPQKYRTKEEMEAKKHDDPIIRLKAYLVNNKISGNEELDRIDDEVKQEVMEAVDFAEKSPVPPLETIYEDVYVENDYPFLTD
ncbi:MAG TPA: pyruvate dehydrogenase (acetyl-transferring) E1 component subunit alpha [Rhodothermales bacterium]|nr:pyruvate dehydrogenase (acetyl-transferring) E1 component subunit alpha [Rhodothermales bacterium]